MKHHSCIRIYVLLLALLAGLFLCAAASAGIISTGACGPNLKWSFDTNGKLTISGTGAMTTNPWDIYREEIKSVVIENGATNIIDNGFQNCHNLKSVSIPGSVKTIGSYAFQKCTNLSSVTIPNGVTNIGRYAFSKCAALQSITIPESVTVFGDSVFYDCSGLKSATVKSKNKDIPFAVLFYSCTNLTTVTVASDSPAYSSKDGVVFNKSGKTLIYCPIGRKGTYPVPSGVTKIESFAYCVNLTSISIPNSVKDLGQAAFYSCKGLTSITIPEGIKTIPNDCFVNCLNLKKATLPHSLEKIGTEAFFLCPLSQVTLYENLREIGTDAFEYDVAIAAPEGSYAAQWARDNNHKLTITAPEYSVTVQYSKDQGTASASPAYGAKGTKITLKATPNKGYLFNGWTVVSGGVKIKDNQFQIGNKDVIIKAKFKKDPSYALVKDAEYKLNLKKKTATYLNPTSKIKTSITIPATITVDGVKYQVTEIASNAFKGCSKLKKVTIGKNITKIGKNAFKNCKKLTDIIIKTTKLTKKGIGSNCFKSISSKPTFKCPKKQKNDYKTWIVKTGKAPKKAVFK